jgi:hypothetical protein
VLQVSQLKQDLADAKRGVLWYGFVQLKRYRGMLGFEAWVPAYMVLYGDRLLIFNSMPTRTNGALGTASFAAASGSGPVVSLPLETIEQMDIDNASKRRVLGLRNIWVWQSWQQATGFSFKAQQVCLFVSLMLCGASHHKTHLINADKEFCDAVQRERLLRIWTRSCKVLARVKCAQHAKSRQAV